MLPQNTHVYTVFGGSGRSYGNFTSFRVSTSQSRSEPSSGRRNQRFLLQAVGARTWQWGWKKTPFTKQGIREWADAHYMTALLTHLPTGPTFYNDKVSSNIDHFRTDGGIRSLRPSGHTTSSVEEGRVFVKKGPYDRAPVLFRLCADCTTRWIAACGMWTRTR